MQEGRDELQVVLYSVIELSQEKVALCQGLLLGLLAIMSLGDVARDAADLLDVPGRVQDREGPVADPAHAPVRPDDAVVDRHALAPLDPNAGLADGLAIRRIDRLEPQSTIGHDGLALAAPDPLERRAEIVEAAATEVGHPEHVLGVLGKLPEELLGISWQHRFVIHRFLFFLVPASMARAVSVPWPS